MKILIYQPIIAPYQIAFFDELVRSDYENKYTIKFAENIGKQKGMSQEFLHERYKHYDNIEFEKLKKIDIGPLIIVLQNPIVYIKDRYKYELIITTTNPYLFHELIAAIFAKKLAIWGQFRNGKNFYSKIVYRLMRKISDINIVYDDNELVFMNNEEKDKAVAINNAVEYGSIEVSRVTTKNKVQDFYL